MAENKLDIKVVGVCGSLREGSYTRCAVEIALAGAKEKGVTTQLIDLKDYELAFCDGRDDQTTYPADVHKLRAEVKGAQGIIVGTPEYHSGLSGVLKNALDLMGFEEFGGKMIGLVGVSGGAMGATHSLDSLRTIARSLHAWAIPEQVSISEAWKAFDDNGNLKDGKLEECVKEVGRQVARFAFLHSSLQAQEFLKAWEGAPDNPGA